ncbi:hypothetical protein D3C80_801690 [compost metagenome]
MVRLVAHFAEEPLLYRQQRHAALHRPLVDALRRAALARHTGQALHGLVLEQLLGSEMYAGLTGTADHLDGNDRVATQLEEVVAQADPLQTQHIGPDSGNALFHFALRGYIGLLQ